MARIRQNGGFVGKINNTTTSGASGIFGPNELQYRRLGGLWPNVTATAAAQIPDEYFEYTTLLLPGNGTNGAQNNTFLDGSTNNFTITRNGNTTQGTFSPFSQTGWGGYASATGQYLTAPGNAAFAFTTNNWTVEAWIYPTALNTYNFIYSRESSTNATSEIEFSYNTSGTLTCAVFVGSTQYTASSSSAAIVANRWQHVAAVRNGGTVTIYVDGTSVGSNATLSTSSINDPGTSFVPNILNQAPAANRGMQGYCSNFRLAIGVAVYTGAFTPPTSPLAATQSSGTNISAITGTQTKILTFQNNRFIDNSVANSGAGWTLTVNGSLSVVAFSPFNPTSSWSAATNGGSGYFDGSGDYLSVADNAAFDFGSGDFTIECWAYTETFASQYNVLVSQWNTSYSFIFRITSSLVGLYINVGNPLTLQDYTASVTNTTGQWNHFCVTRSGSTLTFYKNGASIGTSSISATITNTASDLTVGVIGDLNVNTYHKGYISGMRLIKGTAVAPTITTPPTAITNTSLLLNFTNAGIYDATSKNDLETVGNAQISTAISAKWGSGSMYFDGTGDWLDALASNQLFNLSSGAWTIEAWIYRNASGAAHTILTLYNTAGSNSGLTFYVNASNQLVTDNGVTAALAAGTVASGQWIYVAIVRSGSTTTGYINGSSVGTTAQAPSASQYARIGALATGASAFNGYIQDLRITKGYARTIATPTAAFPTL